MKDIFLKALDNKNLKTVIKLCNVEHALIKYLEKMEKDPEFKKKEIEIMVKELK